MFLGLLLIVACKGEGAGETGDSATDTDEPVDTDVDTDPVDGNDGRDAASAVTPSADAPAAADVAIGRPLDVDWYTFDAIAGHWYELAAVAHTPGAPDLVLQLFGAEDAPLAVNDDLPYRDVGTDPGLLWRADVSGPVWLVAQEWNAYAGTAYPQGGTDYRYDLWVTDATEAHGGAIPYLDPNEDDGNDTLADALANLAAGRADFGDEPFAARAGVAGPGLVAGTLDPDGDADWLGIDAGAGPSIVRLSTPGGWGTAAFTPNVALVDAAGVEVAATDVPTIRDAFVGVGDDDGIAFVAADGGTFAAAVTGAGGEGAWYTLELAVAPFPAEGLHTLDPAEEIEAPADCQTFALDGTLPISTADVAGTFEAGDTFDAWCLDEASRGAAQWVSVNVGTVDLGSSADVRIDVIAEDGSVLGSSADRTDEGYQDSPALLDVELPPSGGFSVLVVLENTVEGPSAYYVGRAILSEDPVFSAMRP